jgi:hypothetical protein
MKLLKIKQITCIELEDDYGTQIYGVSEEGDVYYYLWDVQRENNKKDIGWYKLTMTTE